MWMTFPRTSTRICGITMSKFTREKPGKGTFKAIGQLELLSSSQCSDTSPFWDRCITVAASMLPPPRRLPKFLTLTSLLVTTARLWLYHCTSSSLPEYFTQTTILSQEPPSNSVDPQLPLPVRKVNPAADQLLHVYASIPKRTSIATL